MNDSLEFTWGVAPMVSNLTEERFDFRVDHSHGLINDDQMFYFRAINWSILCSVISAFGVIGNVINMVVFIRTGFKDSITLSLFMLAISDFGSCLTLILSTIVMNPWFRELDLPFESDEISYMFGAWPHVAFTKITTLITAFITVERFLCVSMPLKVKTVITRKRVIAYLVSCYVLIVCIMVPVFYANRLGWKFYPGLNKTLLGLVVTEERETIEAVVFPILNAFLSVFAFVFIVISTVLLVVKLKEKAKWRLTVTIKTGDSGNDVATKEQKISKMVVIISTLFIACFLPTAATQLTMWVERRVAIDGEFSNLVKVLASFTFTLESLNSALNICVYYKNSSNYKATFDSIFRKKNNHRKD